ncbi:hypothetical protein BZG02_08800 [Labilibaculum filiforme]|uniref:Outer membrane protein beta-barrel domain-containing protein n=1 Tax=Labilibaculum filiforme TaxID=1940526 RepID=A0A2N3HZH3_9BACT|nr:hypothetical protein [Labilibaculum filiforme]PKQ63466.1 hypothetical protein BZG02_08800 [Labilibaculum filiforme]
MKKALLLLLVLGFTMSAFSQTTKWRASYYNTNEFGFATFTDSKFYPEIRVKANDDYYSVSEYSLLLRNDFSFKEGSDINLSWGIGASIFDGEFGYFRLPLYLCKNNIISENITLLLGVELKTDLEDDTKLLPKIGISINF